MSFVRGDDAEMCPEIQTGREMWPLPEHQTQA